MFMTLPSLQLSDKQPPPKTSLANYYQFKQNEIPPNANRPSGMDSC